LFSLYALLLLSLSFLGVLSINDKCIIVVPVNMPTCQSKGTIHIPDGSSLQVARGERFFLVFRGLDASSLYGGHFRHEIQLGYHHLQIVEYLYTKILDTKRGRNPLFLHGLVSTGRHLTPGMFFLE
jgi:hypothetical protein